MDFFAAERALGTPDLLLSVFRYLGPLDWLTCASVCPSWSIAILADDDSAQGTRTSCPTSTEYIETGFTGIAAANNATATGSAGEGEGEQIVAEEGEPRTVSSTNHATRGVPARNLWREFAFTVMRCHPNAGSSSSRWCRSKKYYSGWGDDRLGRRRGRARASPQEHFYRRVCLDGDPTILGPPLKANPLVGDMAAVGVKDIRAAASRRSRTFVALCKFLSLWTCYGPMATGKRRQARVGTVPNKLSFPRALESGSTGATGRKGTAPSIVWAQLDDTQHKPRSRACERAAAAKSTSRREVTSAMLNEGVGVFTQLLVICRRCRRSRTTLHASEDCREAFGPAAAAGGDRRSWREKAADTAWVGSNGGLTLWLECHEEGCGCKSEVVARNASSPRWLVKFAEYVMYHKWETVNTLPADHGTHWFSDTSATAVQRRQRLARASLTGLSALTRWRTSGVDDRDQTAR